MPRIVGTGLAALDVIVNHGSEPEQYMVGGGGTCGNVLAALATLGWQSIFVGAVRHSPAARVVQDDLERAGVRVCFLFSDEGSTIPVIVEHVAPGSDVNGAHHWFTFECPHCRQQLPRFSRPADSALQATAPHVQSADVFFVDRLSAAIVDLAAAARQSGAFVMYEPSENTDRHWVQQMLEIAHVVKFSAEYSEELALVPRNQGLWIETRGARGLSWKTQGSTSWRTVPAQLAARVIDTCGAGDWFTVGLLFSLFELTSDPRDATDTQVEKALRLSAALAAWSCGFLGARGPLYDAEASDALTLLRGASFRNSSSPDRKRVPRPQLPANLCWHTTG